MSLNIVKNLIENILVHRLHKFSVTESKPLGTHAPQLKQLLEGEALVTTVR